MFVAFDPRFAPIYVSTFRGDLDLDTVRWHDTMANAAFQAALARGQAVVYVVDARRMELPGPLVRKFWGEEVVSRKAIVDAMAGLFVLVNNAPLRGALTAVRWLSLGASKIEAAATLTEAVELGNKRILALGHAESSIDAFSYQPPHGSESVRP